MTRKKIQAVAYLRTSSAANVGPDKDSDKRQRAAIAAYAKAAGVEIVETFYDEAVSGADLIETRPGFRAMLERLLSNGVRTIVVETANRFARDLMVQEVGYAMLKERGIELIATDKPDAFLDDTPTAVLIRQVLGAVIPVREGDAGLEAARRARSQACDRRQGGGAQEPRRAAPRGGGAGASAAPQAAVPSRDRRRTVRGRPRHQARQDVLVFRHRIHAGGLSRWPTENRSAPVAARRLENRSPCRLDHQPHSPCVRRGMSRSRPDPLLARRAAAARSLTGGASAPVRPTHPSSALQSTGRQAVKSRRQSCAPRQRRCAATSIGSKSSTLTNRTG